MEKIYKTMKRIGNFNLISGICLLIVSLCIGIFLIITGIFLHKRKKDILF